MKKWSSFIPRFFNGENLQRHFGEFFAMRNALGRIRECLGWDQWNCDDGMPRWRPKCLGWALQHNWEKIVINEDASCQSRNCNAISWANEDALRGWDRGFIVGKTLSGSFTIRRQDSVLKESTVDWSRWHEKTEWKQYDVLLRNWIFAWHWSKLGLNIVLVSGTFHPFRKHQDWFACVGKLNFPRLRLGGGNCILGPWTRDCLDWGGLTFSDTRQWPIANYEMQRLTCDAFVERPIPVIVHKFVQTWGLPWVGSETIPEVFD